jgi:signal transduction histidine kinase
MRNKKQIHYAFLSLILSLFIWSLGNLLLTLTGFSSMFYVYFYFIGVIFVPVAFAFLGLIFAYTKIDFNWKTKLLFAFPVVDYLVLLTNDYHHLFFIKYSSINALTVYGKFYIPHTIVLYIYIFVGLAYLLFYSIKNSGFFSKQSLLIILGSCIPFFFNICENFNLMVVPIYVTPVAFSFAIILYALAIFKFDFLNVVPIALQKIVDLISDSYIVINDRYEIIDYNQTFIQTFADIMSIRRKDDLLVMLDKSSGFNLDRQALTQHNNNAIESRKTISFELCVNYKDTNKCFNVELTPIFTSHNYLGTIILLKDITQAKRDLEIIKENQAILLEQERLASLGQLIGGIAHNLKTPIMSLAGGIEAVKDLALEYRDSIGDNSVTEQDHMEIAREIIGWADKMKPYCGYMSDVISAVKGQAVQMNDSTNEKFTVDELIKRVNLLMKHELSKYHCVLNVETALDLYTEIKGEVNNLVQVFDNIIINAIQAYEGNSGNIDLKITRIGDNVEFIFRDYGKGIPKAIVNKLIT